MLSLSFRIELIVLCCCAFQTFSNISNILLVINSSGVRNNSITINTVAKNTETRNFCSSVSINRLFITRKYQKFDSMWNDPINQRKLRPAPTRLNRSIGQCDAITERWTWSTCRFLAQLSLFRPPVLTMADQAVAATYGMDAASMWLSDLGLWDT